ncbi:hypothetical protein Lal_00020209 [Lupinus albus]|nr:hypothetical protein Lal_00020209 [Lupinus albus]
MMRRLRLCCEGADIYIDNEPKEERTEQYHKSKDASVFPAKRKNVKKMACKCFVNCIFGKCKQLLEGNKRCKWPVTRN